MADIVARLQEDIKNSLKSGDKARTDVLRLVLSAVKQKQIDSGTTVDDSGLILIVEKMIKQRRDSIEHYKKAGRSDLQAQEESEINLLQPFVPVQMEAAEIAAAIDKSAAECGASGIKDMGKLMAILKPQLAGRADMAVVSKMVKERLTAEG